MSFISLLKQFGLDVLRGIQIVEGIAPMAVTAAQTMGTINPTQAGKIDSIVQMGAAGLDIEANFAAAFGPDNKGGAAKFAALVPRVQQIILDSQLLDGKQIGDPVLFTKSMQGYSQATADLLNSLKPKIASVDNAGAPSVPSANLPLPASKV